MLAGRLTGTPVVLEVNETARVDRLRNGKRLIMKKLVEKNREKVYQALLEAMGSDKARTRISRISDLGLVEISRERVREDLLRTMSEPCHYCDGRGYTKSPASVVYEIFREIRRLESASEEQTIIIGAHPTVAALLLEEEHEGVQELVREYNRKIVIKADSSLHLEQYDLVVL